MSRKRSSHRGDPTTAPGSKVRLYSRRTVRPRKLLRSGGFEPSVVSGNPGRKSPGELKREEGKLEVKIRDINSGRSKMWLKNF